MTTGRTIWRRCSRREATRSARAWARNRELGGSRGLEVCSVESTEEGAAPEPAASAAWRRRSGLSLSVHCTLWGAGDTRASHNPRLHGTCAPLPEPRSCLVLETGARRAARVRLMFCGQRRERVFFIEPRFFKRKTTPKTTQQASKSPNDVEGKQAESRTQTGGRERQSYI